jgi:hypothetical protein
VIEKIIELMIRSVKTASEEKLSGEVEEAAVAQKKQQ